MILVGFGAATAWIISQTGGIDTTISDIGSPSTNISVSMVNSNNPTIQQTLTVTNSAINTNSDNDQITQTNQVTVTNSNSG